MVEFFWYGCPHCYAFEPLLEAWAKSCRPTWPSAACRWASRRRTRCHQKLYYALEALGQLEHAAPQGVHRHPPAERQRLNNEADIAAFVTANGVDGAKFIERLQVASACSTKASQAKQLAEAYKIDGVPALGIQGRYFTSGSLAGSHERALAVADFLIAARAQGRA